MSEKSHYYKEETFSKWSDFRSFIDKSRLEWIYRAQGNSQWDISTALERFGFDGPIERIDSIEYQILEEFKRAAKHYLSPKHMPTTLVEWLGLIQHYGSPSRLIDFIRSLI